MKRRLRFIAKLRPEAVRCCDLHMKKSLAWWPLPHIRTSHCSPALDSIDRSGMTEGGVGICCITGALHEGTPKGSTDTVAGLPTYVAKPSSSTPAKEGIIVIITDVFGWDFINNRLIADEYAEKSGRTVYLPDLMGGISFLCYLLIGGRLVWRPMLS